MAGQMSFTEADWLAGTDPEPMLEWLRGWASDRKLRLFAVACCRRLWQLLPAEGCDAVLVAERYADGAATSAEASAAALSAAQAARVASQPTRGLWAAHHAAAPEQWGQTAWGSASFAARAAGAAAAGVTDQEVTRPEGRVRRGEGRAQCRLLRCVFGNPFRPVAQDPSWRSREVLALAGSIYDGRAFEAIPILADALVDAGCANEDILNHLRGPGVHVRGCWALDLLLGRE
jgi:hypothetical protein